MKRIALVLLILSLPIPCLAKYSDGSGDPNDPYQISSKDDLLALAADTNDYNKCFILTADINLGATFTRAVIAADTGLGLDFQGVAFTGTFDGNGHKITDFSIYNVGDGNFLGFFGFIGASGSVKNLGLDNFMVNGPLSMNIGGLAGYNNGNISSCYSRGSAIGKENVGGLVGSNFGSISNCFSTGSVTGTLNFFCYGGLSGYNGGSIVNCYSTGTVFGNKQVGGLVGDNSGSISSSYFLKNTSPDNGFGTPLTDEQMKWQKNFLGWDFVNVWRICHGLYYPKLRVFGKYSDGAGTTDNPYQIATDCDLRTFAGDTSNYDKYFILTGDINLDPCTFTTAFIAPDEDNMDVSYEGDAFTGEFNGNGHIISNLTIDTKGVQNHYLGLFGYNMGKIKNLRLINVAVTGGDASEFIGGLAGYNDGNIINCSSTGNVAGGNDSVALGGLVGVNGGSARDCFSAANVAGGNGSIAPGGLVGGNWSGSISNCYSTGAVTGADAAFYIGGLVGDNWNGIISDCFSTGAVNGGDDSDSVGGLAGDNNRDINNCFSTGSVSGSKHLGGLVGYNHFGSRSSSCYFLDTAGPNNGSGQPLTDEQMKQLISFVDWNFNDIWHICDTFNYPKLVWQIPPGDIVCPDGVDIFDLTELCEQWLIEKIPFDIAPPGGDGVVNFADFAVFADQWNLEPDIDALDEFTDEWLRGTLRADIWPSPTGDGIVNFQDFTILAYHWLEGL